MAIVMLRSAEDADQSLLQIERDSKKLEAARLSKEARAILERIRAKAGALRETMKHLRIDPFSPQQAGERIVAALQNAEGGALSGAQMKRAFGLSPAVLHRRRKEHRIVFWRDSRHDFFYPRWQFTETGAMLPGIQDILQMFNSDDEWRVIRYFLGPRKQMNDRRPLDFLRAGEADKVIAHARFHAVENTW
jgi:hypothetical protein